MSENTNLESVEKLEQNSEKAIAYLQTISEFFHWCVPNIEKMNLDDIDSISEDFIKSNEHIIQRIKNVRT